MGEFTINSAKYLVSLSGGYHIDTHATACGNAATPSIVAWYSGLEDFDLGTVTTLYTSSLGTDYANTGFYSNGTVGYFWDKDTTTISLFNSCI